MKALLLPLLLISSSALAQIVPDIPLPPLPPTPPPLPNDWCGQVFCPPPVIHVPVVKPSQPAPKPAQPAKSAPKPAR
jgi:hypothetical protein